MGRGGTWDDYGEAKNAICRWKLQKLTCGHGGFEEQKKLPVGLLGAIKENCPIFLL